MTSITISEINVTGINLFEDGESYLDEMSDADLGSVNGGFSPLIAFATASSPECAAFAGGLISGAVAGIGITRAFK